MNKRFFAALALLLCLCMAITGCGSNAAAPANSGNSAAPAQPAGPAEAPQQDVYIDIWGLWQTDNYRALWMQAKADEYAALHPGVTIEYIYQNSYSGVAEKLTAGAMSGELPVLAQMEESFITMFNPILLNIADYMDEATVNNYNKGLLANSYWDGKLLAVPSNRSMPVLYLNTDILEAAGLDPAGPQTWDELYTYAKAIHEKTDKYGFAIFWDSDAWVWESALYSWGGQVTSDDAKTVTFGDNDAGVHVVELYQKMVSEGIAYEAFSAGAEPTDANQALFLEGELGMYIGSCGVYGKLSGNEALNIKVNFMPQGSTRSAVTGGANWVLPQGSSDAEIEHAIGYLKYLAEDANVIDWMLTSGYLPGTDSAMQSAEGKALIADDPNYQILIDQLQYAHTRPTTPYWREFYYYIVEKLELAMISPDTTDAHALIADCVAKCQAIIEANG
ncbi:MAG: ABC transporter substrate-binding protein [Christensenellaceae bacterium]|jgi:sn-glycerol 3-phosphate transport system substrate-binding protein|nr:ABC transporter substrate-binding protein [Christensenellaceae bacterium]